MPWRGGRSPFTTDNNQLATSSRSSQPQKPMIASPTYNLRIKSPAIIQRKIALYNAKGALPLPGLSD
jgi:hypothetical protein